MQARIWSVRSSGSAWAKMAIAGSPRNGSPISARRPAGSRKIGQGARPRLSRGLDHEFDRPRIPSYGPAGGRNLALGGGEVDRQAEGPGGAEHPLSELVH